ncbi:MAG TPA: CPBP family glutamic-type intramembrane protease [Caulobacteraceae bacterium]|nr:CPBP family glutamic-type intramembrane protease [Caulobacteraceae bacterium]
MAQLIEALARRLGRSLTTWPDRDGWRYAAGVGALTLAAMAAVGFASGYYRLTPTRTEGLAKRLLSVWLVPALGEEAPFRGLMIPGRDEAARPPWRALALFTPIYTAWHVLEARTFLPAARSHFLRWDFLACTSILGVGCGLVRWRTRSLWPAVALHGVAVTIWQTWLGGFVLDD